MKRYWRVLVIAVAATGLLVACSHVSGGRGEAGGVSAVARAIQEVRAQYAPDSHLGIYTVGLDPQGRELVLTGEVDRAEAKLETLRALERTGVKVTERVRVLPEPGLGEQVWGIACLSVASAREKPEHKAEMGTQILMGGVVRVWKSASKGWWYYVQSADGYPAWLEKGTFVRCTREQVEAWNCAPRLIVTALEDTVLEKPQAEAQPVSDVVIANLLKRVGETGEWYQVELPDGRQGYLPKHAAADFGLWQQTRQPTAENIEGTARRLLGRPYLWGGNSPKGLDCSGFTQLVFYLNGVELNRNASQQARQGQPVPLDGELSQLKKGDLLFFGARARTDQPERVRHVGIYLGNNLFIHASERVQINSLEPDSPVRDEPRLRSLLSARRVLSGES